MTSTGQLDFGGRRAVVTGAAQNIGRAIALGLARAGAWVAVTDVNDAAGKAVVLEINAAGGRATYFHMNVLDPNEVGDVVGSIAAMFGGITNLVNNAVSWQQEGELARVSQQSWRDNHEMLLGSYFTVTNAALSEIGQGGAIVNMASVHGLLASPNWGAYDIAKAGVIQMTRVYANELGPRGIRVNAVAPGIVETAREAEAFEQDPRLRARLLSTVPLRELGSPEAVASGVIFLLSDQARYITGQTLVIDGGLTSTLQLTVAQEQWRATK